MMAEKARLFGDDLGGLGKILASPVPEGAEGVRAEGSRLRRRSAGSKVRSAIVRPRQRSKSTGRTTDLRRMLLSTTEPRSSRRARTTTIWGIGMAMTDAGCRRTRRNWRGQNLLGKIIAEAQRHPASDDLMATEAPALSFEDVQSLVRTDEPAHRRVATLPRASTSRG